MINEVLDLIVQAEKEAQQIIDNANEKAGKLASESGVKCHEIAENSVSQAKKERGDILACYQKQANEEYDRIIEEKQHEASELLEAKSDIADKIGSEIFGRIVNGNC